MKKPTLLGIFMSLFFIAQAQTDSVRVTNRQNGKNEIKINLFQTVLGLPEINYERILNEESSIGLSLSVRATEEDVYGRKYNFIALPYYRIFFGKKKAAGFFIETNAAAVNLTEKTTEHVGYNTSGWPAYQYVDKTSTAFGLGAAIGVKFITRNGFVGELSGGAGRLLADLQTKVYPRGGVTIGKRF